MIADRPMYAARKTKKKDFLLGPKILRGAAYVSLRPDRRGCRATRRERAGSFVDGKKATYLLGAQ
jgi:hypothetical protein